MGDSFATIDMDRGLRT